MSVTIYTTPTCGVCKTAKRYMNERGIAFDSVDVEEDVESFNLMYQATEQSAVPQFNIDGQWFVGFNKAMFDPFDEDFLADSNAYMGEMEVCESCQ